MKWKASIFEASQIIHINSKFRQVWVCHSRPASCAGMSQTDDLGQNGHKDLNEVQAQLGGGLIHPKIRRYFES